MANNQFKHSAGAHRAQPSDPNVTSRIPAQTAQNAAQATRVHPVQTQRVGTHSNRANSVGYNRSGAYPDPVLPVDLPPKKEEPKPRDTRSTKIAAAVIAGIVLVVYIAGVIAFSNLYYPNTQIAGVDVSMSSRSSAAQKIENSIKSYALNVNGCGLDWTYTPAEGTFSIDAQELADTVLKADSAFGWPVHFISSLASGNQQAVEAEKNASVKATYDSDDFTQQLTAAVDAFNTDRAGTFDAAGAYDEAQGKFTVQKARSSQRLSYDAVLAAATAALEAAQPTCTIDDSAYELLAGGATDEQLQAACDSANELLGVNVNLTMGGQTVATLDGKQMCQWITFDDSLNPTLNQDQLSAWIRELASTKLDTAGSTRTYTRGDGKQITATGGSYGWISNEDELATKIQEAVANKQTGDIEVPTKQTAAKYTDYGQADWGAYVDVDLSEQHAYYYDADGNLLWESGIISGNPNEGNDTPTGIYAVNSKENNVTLTGKKDPNTGQPIYVSYVDYWMGFIGGAVGLHDASWQATESFSNPEAYKSVGSHGCVNLPPDKAAELFNIINVGDCVIVHN